MKYLICMLCSVLLLTEVSAKISNRKQQFLFRGGYGEGGFDPDRMMIGGNLGMNFFDKGYSAFVAPTIGYSFGRFQLGISAGYNFNHQKIEYINRKNNLPDEYAYSASDYNASLFARLAILGPFFLHAEPGYGSIKVLQQPFTNFEVSTGKAIETSFRINVPFVLVGAGFGFPVGERVSFIIYGLYDVLQNEYSPYKGLPVIRGGFNVGAMR